jgi:DNA-binding HxlR family transcriptional regulator
MFTLPVEHTITVRVMKKTHEIPVTTQCSYNLLAIQDAMDVLSGKWKIPIIGALRVQGKMHFTDLIREVHGISAKVLAKELRELESNELITRTELKTKPVKVEYQLTDYGKTLEKVIFDLLDWGLSHRRKVTGRTSLENSASEYVIQLRKSLPDY